MPTYSCECGEPAATMIRLNVDPRDRPDLRALVETRIAACADHTVEQMQKLADAARENVLIVRVLDRGERRSHAAPADGF